MQYGDDGLDLGRRELLEWSFTSQSKDASLDDESLNIHILF